MLGNSLKGSELIATETTTANRGPGAAADGIEFRVHAMLARDKFLR